MPFSPLDIPNCGFWVKSNTGVTKDESDKVSNWADQSGNGRNAGQGDPTRQPTWYDNQLNGYPGIYFSQPNFNLATVAFSLVQPITLFLVGKCHRGSEYPYWCDGTAGGFTMAVGFWGDEPSYGYGLSAGTTCYSYKGYDDLWVILSNIFSGANSYQYLDKVKIQGPVNVGTGSPSGIILGMYGGGGNYTLQGYLVEVILYTRSLTDDERQQVENYLYDRYFVISTTTTTPSPTTTTTTTPPLTTTTTPPPEEPLLFIKWLDSYG